MEVPDLKPRRNPHPRAKLCPHPGVHPRVGQDRSQAVPRQGEQGQGEGIEPYIGLGNGDRGESRGKEKNERRYPG